MQNLQRESKTPYGNQRKITSLGDGGSYHQSVLNALRQSEENHLDGHLDPLSVYCVLNALRQSEENHLVFPTPWLQIACAQRLTAIRGKSLVFDCVFPSRSSCSTPYGNQRKITSRCSPVFCWQGRVLNALRQSEENHGVCAGDPRPTLVGAQRLTAIRGKSRETLPRFSYALAPCSTPYGNQRKITVEAGALFP